MRSQLGVFGLTMLSVSAIVSLRNLPMMATQGLASICFYGLAALVFLIPSALVCAELATGWPERGGVYTWVRAAFGNAWGFFAIWAEWILTLLFFPALIGFIVSTFAYLVDPAWVHNPWYIFGSTMCVFWGATLINMRGIETSSWFSSIGAVFGILIPGGLILWMGYYAYQLDPSTVAAWTWADLVPCWKAENLVFFVAVLLGFEGMELIAFHAREVRDPARQYPIAILLTTLLILLFSVAGSLALGQVLAPDQIRLMDGLMQTMQHFCSTTQIPWITELGGYAIQILGALLLMGSLAGLNAWVASPVKAVLDCVESGYVPRYFQAVNRYGVPVRALLVQGILGSVISVAYLAMPSVEGAYVFLTVLAGVFAVLMYLLIFAAAIRLRYTAPDVPRAYRIPGGNIGVWITSGLGCAGCLCALVVSGMRPAANHALSPALYAGCVLAGVVLLSLPPIVLAYRHSGTRSLHAGSRR